MKARASFLTTQYGIVLSPYYLALIIYYCPLLIKGLPEVPMVKGSAEFDVQVRLFSSTLTHTLLQLS